MYVTYILNQKFDMNRISYFIMKVIKKLETKNNYSMNNQVTYPFSI